MKKKLALLLAAAMLFSMFAGCASNEPAVTPTPGTTASTGSNANDKTDSTDTPAPEKSEEPEEDSPYNFAPGKYNADERGLATEHYTYELPLTTTDEVLTMWTNIYTAQHVPEDGYQSMPVPTADREKTGVNIEYTLVTSDARRTQFSVMRAADDLCDIMCYTANIYGGSPTAIIDEGYFVNLYDYREYMPNYMYLVAHHDPTDRDTYDKVFLAEDMVASMYILYANPVINGTHFVRGDWLDEMGLKADDIDTWDELYDVLLRVKNEYESCVYPFSLIKTIDRLGAYVFTSHDTIPLVSDSTLGPYFLLDGKVTFSHMNEADTDFLRTLHRFMDADMVNPNWTAYGSGSDYRTMADTGETFYYYMTCADSQNARFSNVDEDCRWEPLGNPLVTKDQVMKVGIKVSRSLGNCYNIASSCENIELAVTWCDWCFSPEGGELWSYGLEGQVWEYNEKGDRVLTEFLLKNPEGLSVTWALSHYAGYVGGTAMLFYNRRNFMDPNTGADAWGVAEFILDWNKAHFDGSGHYPAGARLSDEDQEIVDVLSGDVTTYIAENYMLFANQDLDIDTSWDDYVQGLYDIGMQDIIDAYQRAYDSYIA